MHNFLRLFAVAAFIAIPAIPVFAQTPAPASGGVILTLHAALAKAYQSSPYIAAAGFEVAASEGALRQAGIVPNPELAALLEDQQKSTRTTTVQVSQSIELGGKRSARIAAATRGQDAARADLLIKRVEVRAAVSVAFFEVLALQERYRLAEDATVLAKRATNAASRRVSAGKISPVEETRAQLAESAVRIELAQTASELANARQSLNTVLAEPTGSAVQVDGVLDALPAAPDWISLSSRLPHSAYLLRADLEVDRRNAMTAIERSRQFADVVLSVGSKRDAQVGHSQAIIGFSIPLPLFDRNQGNMQEALRRTDKAREDRRAAELRLASELAQAAERYRSGRAEADILKNDILPGARSAFDAATKGFEFGKFNFLDVLDAQRTLLAANNQYARALADAWRNAAEIERLLGGAPGVSLLPDTIKP